MNVFFGQGKKEATRVYKELRMCGSRQARARFLAPSTSAGEKTMDQLLVFDCNYRT